MTLWWCCQETEEIMTCGEAWEMGKPLVGRLPNLTLVKMEICSVGFWWSIFFPSHRSRWELAPQHLCSQVKKLSERRFTVEGPCFDLFAVFPILYFKRYVLIVSEPAIFHGFICPRCSWASHPSVFNLLWQKFSCCKRCLALRVVSRSSDGMAWQFPSFVSLNVT